MAHDYLEIRCDDNDVRVGIKHTSIALYQLDVKEAGTNAETKMLVKEKGYLIFLDVPKGKSVYAFAGKGGIAITENKPGFGHNVHKAIVPATPPPPSPPQPISAADSSQALVAPSHTPFFGSIGPQTNSPHHASIMCECDGVWKMCSASGTPNCATTCVDPAP